MALTAQPATRSLGGFGVRRIRIQEGIEIKFSVPEPSAKEGVPDPCLVIEALKNTIQSAAALARLQQGNSGDGDERTVTVRIPPTIRVICEESESTVVGIKETMDFLKEDELRVLCEVLVKNSEVTQGELFGKSLFLSKFKPEISKAAPRIQELLGPAAFHDLVLRAVEYTHSGSSALLANRIKTDVERNQESAYSVLAKLARLIELR